MLSEEIWLDSTQMTPSNWKYFQDHLFLQTGILLRHSIDKAFIQFSYSRKAQAHHYTIHLTENDKVVTHSSQTGQFYAINSLLQLIRKDGMMFYIQGCQLFDYSKFNWRGLHLDVSRHFFTVDEVKRYIDLMALYKFNTFHWHLTDDQGWRIEILKYPELTEIGGYRDSTMIGHYSDQPRTFEKETYGGYYTQDEIREVVQYAKKRYITVVPEIEFPGHARAALAAYPELSCTGKQNGIPGTWGIFDDIFCSKPETIEFMKGVLAEVVELFPSEYIHIGGDEAPKTRWNNCPNCQKVMSDNNLQDAHELQSYFIGEMDAFLTSRGKKLIGWDEILEGGLSPNAAVMSWRGTKGGIAAAKLKHEVVMTPTTYCYFDYYQSAHPTEPIAIGGYLPLEKVYKFNPIPKGISEAEERYILGGQANLWTEYIASMEHLEYMAYPRALALAQSVWCEKKPSYQSFLSDFVTYQEDYLDRYNVNYARSIHQPKMEITRKKRGINVHFKGVEEGYKLELLSEESGKFSVDESVALGTSDSIFMKRAEWGKEPEIIQASVVDGEGRKSLETTFIVHAALGSEIEMITRPHPKFNNNGSLNLVDGIRGVLPWKGSQWLGFDTSYVEFIVDLGVKRKISSVELSFLDQNGLWIYLPENVTIQVGKKSKWRDKKEFIADVDGTFRNLVIGKKGRYVRVIVRAMDMIPEGQQGGGNPPWTFIDEILIR